MSSIGFMRRALELARLSLDEGEFPVAAVAVLNDEIIGEGRRQPHLDSRLDHAEMLVLRQISATRKKMPSGTLDSGITIYSTLEPCMQCMGALLNYRIGLVHYALEDTYGGACRLLEDMPIEQLPLRHRVGGLRSSGGMLREDARLLFKEFFLTTNNNYWKGNLENPLYRMTMEE